MPVDLEKYRKPQPTGTVDLSKYKKAPSAPVAPPPERSLFDKVIDNPVTRGIQKYIPGAKVGQAIGTLGGLGITAARETFGSVPKGTTAAYDISAPSPLQTIGDVAKGAATVAGIKAPVVKSATALGTIAKSALQGGAMGALGGAGQAATQTSGKPLPTAQDTAQVAKGAAIGGATGAAASAAVSSVSQVLQRAGEKIMLSKIKPSKADIEDGFSIDTIKKYDLGGSLSGTLSKTEKRMDDLSRELNAKLSSTNTKIDLKNVYKNTIKKLGANKLSSFGSNTSTKTALSQLEGEIREIVADGKVSIVEAQTIKRAAGHYGAWTFGQVDPDSTARQKVYSAFYNQIKEEIEKSSPEGVAEINKQLSELIPVMNAVIRRIPVAERNNLFSLSDVIALSSSAIDPSGLGVAALNIASKSGRIGNALSKVGEKATAAARPLGAIIGTGSASLLQKDDN